jgi:hypothetical protein
VLFVRRSSCGFRVQEIKFGRAELECYGEGNAYSCARSLCLAMLTEREGADFTM